MIVKLSGGIDRVLMLAPVLIEYQSRNPEEDIYLETDYPELACGEVKEAAVFIDRHDEPVVVLDIFSEIKEDVHIMDLYAGLILGDTRMRSRHIPSWGEPQNPVDRISVDVGLSSLLPHLVSLGDVHRLDSEDDYFKNIQDVHDSRLFIGLDNSLAHLAMTTLTPMIVVFDKRSPKYIRPFRRDIPFEAIVPSYDVCPSAPFCLKKNGFMEFKYTYGVKCDNDDAFACERFDAVPMIMEAVKRILYEW